LGRASVYAEFCVVGTDNAQGSSYLICVDTATIENICSNIVTSYHEVQGQIRDVHWLSGTLILAAVGEHGQLQLFNINSNRSEVSHHSTINGIHFSYIRETAVQPGSSSIIASGGMDNTLCITDLNAKQPLLIRLNLDEAVSSVKWSEWNAACCVSSTTDSGIYSLYDSRVMDNVQAAWRYNPSKAGLLAHERYSDHCALLGYEDGTLVHIDMRNSTKPV
jgi:WD40 repeat protein